jgi:hypothetical protein
MTAANSVYKPLLAVDLAALSSLRSVSPLRFRDESGQAIHTDVGGKRRRNRSRQVLQIREIK